MEQPCLVLLILLLLYIIRLTRIVTIAHTHIKTHQVPRVSWNVMELKLGHGSH